MSSYARHDGLDHLCAGVARNRKAGPTLPPASLRRRYRVRKEEVAGMRTLRVASKGGLAVAPMHPLPSCGCHVLDLIAPQWALVTGLVDRLDAEIVVPLYPLAPEQTVGTVLPRIVEVYGAVAAEAGPGNLALVGDSAGGGLALALAQTLRDRGEPPPAALSLYFPWLGVPLSDPEQVRLETVDLTLSMPQLREAGWLSAGDRAPDDPSVSPLFGTFAGLPPTLAQSGGRDLLVADCRRPAARWTEVTMTEYPGMFHGWMCAPIPEARRALDETAAFLGRHLGGAVSAILPVATDHPRRP